jgi:ribosomal protein L3
LEIIDVRSEMNLLLIKGGVPGWRNGVLIIQEAKKKASKPKGET